MGKSDQNKTQNAITQETDRSQEQSREGISTSQNRVDQLTPMADQQKADTWSGYSNLAATGGISQADRDRLISSQSGNNGSGGGGNGGGGNGTPSSGPSDRVGTTAGFESRFGVGSHPDYLNTSDSYLKPTGVPDYVGTFADISGKNGGYDPGRMAAIEGDANTLRNTRQNYGDVNKSISGLQDLAATGGVSSADFNNIDRKSLLDMESNGGYTADDKANLRARSNSAVAATYGSLKDNLDRSKLVAGNIGPGWSSAGFKLARQGAQDIGTNARNTEVDLNNAVNSNRMAAASKLSDNNLGLQGIKTNASIAGYTNAGNLGNTRESQIDAATASAAGIDTRLQDSINNARLSAAGGLSQDTIGKMDVSSKDALGRMNVASNDELGRMGIASTNELGHASIGAGASAAANALASENQRFLINETDQNRATGLGGMLNTYKAAPDDLNFNQSLLANYRNSAAQQQQGLIGARTSASYIPGLSNTIGGYLGVAGQAAGLASGGLSGFSGFGTGNKTDPYGNTANNPLIYGPGY